MDWLFVVLLVFCLIGLLGSAINLVRARRRFRASRQRVVEACAAYAEAKRQVDLSTERLLVLRSLVQRHGWFIAQDRLDEAKQLYQHIALHFAEGAEEEAN